MSDPSIQWHFTASTFTTFYTILFNSNGLSWHWKHIYIAKASKTTKQQRQKITTFNSTKQTLHTQKVSRETMFKILDDYWFKMYYKLGGSSPEC